MQKLPSVVVATLLLASPLAAGTLRLPDAAKPESSVKTFPLKGAASANGCAAYGPGFVKVEGTNTCMHVGGSISVDAGTSAGGTR
ncbi:MAG: hypothetical protein ACREDC_01820 [Bradyrhizobium sp.]